ncbi:MAG: hypothetical protein ACD_10C00887G0002 [uncultured bacterium]|nr:MAG: hypothetical protein ACD_10C00887G0002 [uncultured bacterium]
MRTATKVNEITFTIQRNLLTRRNSADQLGLVFLALAKEKRHRFITPYNLTTDRDIFFRQFGHSLFNRS